MKILDWFPLGLTGLISLQSKGFSRVFSNTTIRIIGISYRCWEAPKAICKLEKQESPGCNPAQVHGTENQGPVAKVPVRIQRPKNQECQNLKAGEVGCLNSSREQIHSSPTFSFYSKSQQYLCRCGCLFVWACCCGCVYSKSHIGKIVKVVLNKNSLEDLHFR